MFKFYLIRIIHYHHQNLLLQQLQLQQAVLQMNPIYLKYLIVIQQKNGAVYIDVKLIHL